MAKKTWIEKRDCNKSYKIKTIDKKFADIPEGSKMFIATPRIIDDYIKHIPYGKSTELSTMRNDLAIEYQADNTCPRNGHQQDWEHDMISAKNKNKDRFI